MKIINVLSQNSRTNFNNKIKENQCKNFNFSNALTCDTVCFKGEGIESNSDASLVASQTADKYTIIAAMKEPEKMINDFRGIKPETNDFEINSLVSSKETNYSPELYYLLLKAPDEFFEMASETNFLLHALQNESQQYLDLIERCMQVDPQRTIALLNKVCVDTENSRPITPLVKAIDNEKIDYSEFLKVCYQQDRDAAVELFTSEVVDKNGQKMNFLTYYVQQKAVKADDFITYLSNSDTLLVNQLLSRQSLVELKESVRVAKMNAIKQILCVKHPQHDTRTRALRTMTDHEKGAFERAVNRVLNKLFPSQELTSEEKRMSEYFEILDEAHRKGII